MWNRGKGKGKGQGSSKKVTKQQRRAEEMALVASQALTALRASDLACCVRILCDQGAAFRPFLEDLRKDLPSAPVQSQLMQLLRKETKLGMAAELIAAIGQEHADELVPLLHAMLHGEVDMITAIRIILEPENKHYVRNCVLTVLLPRRCIKAVQCIPVLHQPVHTAYIPKTDHCNTTTTVASAQNISATL